MRCVCVCVRVGDNYITIQSIQEIKIHFIQRSNMIVHYFLRGFSKCMGLKLELTSNRACNCACVYMNIHVMDVCVCVCARVPFLTDKLEVGWLLLWGLNLGLGGFPARRSLCLLLFMC